MPHRNEEWTDTITNLKNLTLYRFLLDEPPLKALMKAADLPSPSQDEIGTRLLYELSQVRLLWDMPSLSVAANPWEAWLIHVLIHRLTPWAIRIERRENPGSLLDDMMRHDLRLLHSARSLFAQVIPGTVTVDDQWQPGRELDPPPLADQLVSVVQALSEKTPWDQRLAELTKLFQTAGAGVFNQAGAFVWDPGTGEFSPTPRLDPTRLEHLIGYENQRHKVRQNTARFLRGAPAHNLLLYGDRGTGKSATVKALVHEYKDQGLRLIEIPKRYLADLPRLVKDLGERGLPFILFIDDLSFERDETGYKDLKAILEGSIQAPPENVKVYATSNRRHLVRENFSDRAGIENDDVRAHDTMEERLSLADRFGETIVFPAPQEEEYLNIVQGLAAQRGIDLPTDVIAHKALQWARWQNGRSGRTARQFVDMLVAAAKD